MYVFWVSATDDAGAGTTSETQLKVLKSKKSCRIRFLKKVVFQLPSMQVPRAGGENEAPQIVWTTSEYRGGNLKVDACRRCLVLSAIKQDLATEGHIALTICGPEIRNYMSVDGKSSSA